LVTGTACDRQADGGEKASQELAAGEKFGRRFLFHGVDISIFSKLGQLGLCRIDLLPRVGIGKIASLCYNRRNLTQQGGGAVFN
jgi:hypothetical protein